MDRFSFAEIQFTTLRFRLYRIELFVTDSFSVPSSHFMIKHDNLILLRLEHSSSESEKLRVRWLLDRPLSIQ